MRSRTFPLLGICAGFALAVAAAAVATEGATRARASLDQRLVERARGAEAALALSFEHARQVVLSTAAQPALTTAYEDLRASPQARAALTAVTRVHPGSVGLRVFDRDGTERARAVGDRVAPAAALSHDLSSAPFFASAVVLDPGDVHQTGSYRSSDTGKRVIGTSTPVILADGTSPGILHLETSIASLPLVSGHGDGVAVALVEARTGKAVTPSGTAPGDGVDRFAFLRDTTSSGPTTRDGLRVSFERLPGGHGNANRWLVVAAAPAMSPLAGVGLVAPILLALALLVLVFSMWALLRSGDGERTARLEAEEQSRIDPLTGVFNRRHGAETISSELSRGAREGHAPGLLLLDIDNFKQVNDVYGHHVGDLVIKEVGRRAQVCVREYDVVVRWGGEEFAVILPGSKSESDVEAVAERIRKMVAFAPVRVAERTNLQVSVSVGGVLAGGGTSTAEGLAEAADRSLYAAKRRGRNCVVMHSTVTGQDASSDEPESMRLARGLALAVSVREAVPEEHCEQVAELAARVAEKLGLSKSVVMRCRLGGWVHDVGKVAIPDRIIGKPTPLDEGEREILQSHVTMGAEIVGRIAGLRDAAAAVLHHHERWDGTGYPDRLAGAAIPIEARIVAAADAYSAITAGRAYQPPLPQEAALAQLRRSAGRSLDPDVVEALTTIVLLEPETARVPVG